MGIIGDWIINPIFGRLRTWWRSVQSAGADLAERIRKQIKLALRDEKERQVHHDAILNLTAKLKKAKEDKDKISIAAKLLEEVKEDVSATTNELTHLVDVFALLEREMRYAEERDTLLRNYFYDYMRRGMKNKLVEELAVKINNQVAIIHHEVEKFKTKAAHQSKGRAFIMWQMGSTKMLQNQIRRRANRLEKKFRAMDLAFEQLDAEVKKVEPNQFTVKGYGDTIEGLVGDVAVLIGEMTTRYFVIMKRIQQHVRKVKATVAPLTAPRYMHQSQYNEMINLTSRLETIMSKALGEAWMYARTAEKQAA